MRCINDIRPGTCHISNLANLQLDTDNMANLFKRIIDAIFGPDPEPPPPLTPEQFAAVERFLFEIFAQQRARAGDPVGAVLFSPRLRRRRPEAIHMDQGMTVLFENGWVETHNVRFLIMTEAGYARMQALGIKYEE